MKTADGIDGLPAAAAPLYIGLGYRVVGTASGGREPHTLCYAPRLLYIHGAARQGPTSRLLGWASPIRTRVKSSVGRWANWWRSTLTFSPLISLYTFKTLYLDITLFTFSLIAFLLVHVSLQIST